MLPLCYAAPFTNLLFGQVFGDFEHLAFGDVAVVVLVEDLEGQLGLGVGSFAGLNKNNETVGWRLFYEIGALGSTPALKNNFQTNGTFLNRKIDTLLFAEQRNRTQTNVFKVTANYH